MPAPRKKLRARAGTLDDAASSITPESLVRRWDYAVTVGTLKNWRSQGRGPPWTKLERQVVYPLEQLVEWESKHTTKGAA